MKIYKVYSEASAECRTNAKEDFEQELMSQNGGTAEFFTDREKAEKAYKAIYIRGARKYKTAITFYDFAGKLIEEVTVDDEDYKRFITDGEDLESIYYNACPGEITDIEVSEPVTD